MRKINTSNVSNSTKSAKDSGGLVDKVSVSQPRDRGFEFQDRGFESHTTMIPHMTPVYVGSRKRTRE